MSFEPAPFDVVEASRRVWRERWDERSAAGNAVFTAILRSHQLLVDQVNEVMRRFDLTFPRHQVLTWLATDPESARTLSWISKTLRVPPATVSNLIDRLEADGLVRRERHPSDARTTLAVITAEGRRLEEAATAALNADVYDRIGLSMAKRDQLVALLGELRAEGGEFDVGRSEEVLGQAGRRSSQAS